MARRRHAIEGDRGVRTDARSRRRDAHVMSVPLESLATCFQGLLPAQLFTCSRDGVPNAAYLSHVDYVDSTHVALSFQFFNKSRRNISENPHALVDVIDPDTGQGWLLRLVYERSETEGLLFDRMALRIEAIASYCGLKGIFKLRAADVYKVVAIEAAPEEAGGQPQSGLARTSEPRAVFTMKAMQDLAERIHRADCLEGLVDSILEGLDEGFGFKHSMILAPTEEDGVLVTIGSRGYAETGVGAEVRFGEGIGGMVAEARKPIRISGLMRGMLYALAMHRESTHEGIPPRLRIPLPGLANPESQLGVPLLVRSELVGVLCLESEVRYRFHEEDKASIEVLGNYLAIAIQNMQLLERMADAQGKDNAAATIAARPGGTRCERPPTPASRNRLSRDRRMHHGRWRIPDSQPAGANFVAAADASSTPADVTSSRTASSGSTSRSTFLSTKTTSRAGCSCSADVSRRSVRTSSSCRGPAAALGWSSRATLR